MHLIWIVDRQALLTHRRSLGQRLLLALGFQGPVGLQGTAEVQHRVHAGHALGIGAHYPIGEAALLVLDLLGEIPHRRQLQRPLKQLVGFRFVGLALDGSSCLKPAIPPSRSASAIPRWRT